MNAPDHTDVDFIHIEARAFLDERAALRALKTLTASLGKHDNVVAWRVFNRHTQQWAVVAAGDRSRVERLLRKADGRLLVLDGDELHQFGSRYLELKSLGPGCHETVRDGRSL